MKARHCDECKHATVKWYEYRGPPAFDVLTCAKGHKPRHYMPRKEMDTDYGWKRVCADFETHNVCMTGARLGGFHTPAACHAAAANLAQGKNYRCISQQTGEVK